MFCFQCANIKYYLSITVDIGFFQSEIADFLIPNRIYSAKTCPAGRLVRLLPPERETPDDVTAIFFVTLHHFI
jgi:hypothetical protein